MKSIENIRHSLAHLLAMAVKQKYPEAKLGIGPAIDNGFYYDFDFSGSAPKAEDLAKLEKDVHALIKKNIKFEPEEISVAEAKKIFASEPYKLELVEELEKDGQKISIYRSGDFVDLCAGPHITTTTEIDSDSFKLDRLAGAYWRGRGKKKKLPRIYRFGFFPQSVSPVFNNVLTA